jgi:hypothetical protein
VVGQRDTALGAVEASDGSESFAYSEIDALEGLSLQEVESLWDLVPTEDRDFITRRYRTLVSRHQVGSDEQEMKLADDYLQRYRYEGLVPAGENWVKISSAKRLEMKRGETNAAEFDEDDRGGTPWMTLAVVGFGLFLLIFLGIRLLGGRNNAASVAIPATVTPTETPTPTFTPSPIPTITPTATPTPIALVESDRFIAAGDGRNRSFFPVQFQINRPDDVQPRVFIVQERLVELTEWVFDPNPDVVSWISRTNIRPVLGIPYSQANEVFIRSLGPGTSFALRMNTGTELNFTFTSASEVGRQDTRLFQQIEPGVVLVLIGQIDGDGLPTSTRYVVSGTYDPGNKLDLTGFTGLPATVGKAVYFPALAVVVNDSYIIPVSGNTSSDFMYAVVDITLAANEEDVPLTTYQWFLDMGDTRYSPDLSVASGLTYSSIPALLPAGQTVQASAAFLVSQFGGDALFLFAPPGVPAKQVLVPFNPPPIPASVAGLDVQLRRVWRDASHVYVDVRVYNPQTEAVTLDLDHIGIVLGFTPNPTGPTHRPNDFAPILFEPEFALDQTLSFAWNADDPFATLRIAGRVWTIQLIE